MSSSKLGKNTSEVEVTDISPHGLWLLIDDAEHFLPHAEYPWFQDAKLSSFFNVRRESPEHLYWPELDVDLSLESIRHPDKYPLKAKQ